MIILRPYQEKLISDVRLELQKGHRGVLLQSPTGSGKTATTAYMISEAYKKNKTVWFVVHREELVKQSSLAFNKINLPHGIVSAGWPTNYGAKVQICSIMTLKNRLDLLARPDMIIYDECQYMGASTWDYIFEQNPNAYHIGLSATPMRGDGKGFKKYFSSMVCGPSVKWLIDNKFLSDYTIYAPTNFDSSRFKISKGDYDQKEVDEFMNKPTIIGDCFDKWSQYAHGKKTIAFTPSVQFSKNLVESFLLKGISAKHLDGETPSEERERSLKEYADGKIIMLSNCNLFVEGFDDPGTEAMINCKPTKVLSRYLQAIGRILRVSEGKDKAIIIDQVNGCYDHGLPDDDFEWTLDDREKKKHKKGDKPEAPVKICQSCFSANHAVNRFCINCGAAFEVKQRTGPDEIDGDLEEINKADFRKRRKMEEKNLKSMDDAIALGAARGYKNPKYWAALKYKNKKWS